MEHIKRQIEEVKTQANLFVRQLTGTNITADLTLKLLNTNGSECFTEQEATEIERMVKESGCFKEKAVGGGYDGKIPWFFYIENKNFDWSFIVRLTVKESRETEMDRLRRRLAELEGGER